MTSAVYNGHTYSLLSNSNWTDAEAKAVSFGGHLVTVNDVAENNWLVDTFISDYNLGGYLWIGLNDLAAPGDFVWVSGDSASYRNWNASGYPFPGSGRNYVTLTGVGVFGGWANTQNDAFAFQRTQYGVVEVNAVSEPASLAAPGVGALALLRRRRK